MCACVCVCVLFFNGAGDRQCSFLQGFSMLPLLSACAFTIMPNYGFVTETICSQNYTYVTLGIRVLSLILDFYNTNNLT